MADDDFLDAMADVQKLKQTKRIVEKTKKHLETKETTTFSGIVSPKVNIQRFEADFQFQEKGLSAANMQRVTSELNIESTLDLHGLYVQPALERCVVFIKQSLRLQRRLVRIIHGRGLHSPDGRPVLKEEVFRWLKEGPYSSSILAVKPAQRGGASLVYLRRQR